MHWIYAHLIGDYLLQTDWMARNKKGSTIACLTHVLVYMLPFCFTHMAWWQLLLIGSQHFLQDRTHFVARYMRFTGSRVFSAPPYSPWSVIVVDNVFHILFIACVTSMSIPWPNTTL